jgi:diguanylate cyclase (GGDEF)-like protein
MPALPSGEQKQRARPRGGVAVPFADSGHELDAVTLDAVDAAFANAQRLLRLKFAPAIERCYEAETRAARAWHIRLTVALGLVAYLAFSLVDSTLIPDLGWVPTLLRLFVITPVGLFAMWMCSRVGAAFREGFISIAITATLWIPVGFIVVSRAPMAPYTMLPIVLVSMFGNITMRLHFHWACAFSSLTIAAIMTMLWLRPDLPAGLAGAILIATLTGVIFGIVANNQLERAERRAFLMALRELLHARQLSADKASISALSFADALTGLPNRRAFDTAFERFWHEWETLGQRFAVVMIDVDFFKRFNDCYGHPAGDEGLRRIGRILRSTVGRQRDLVARYGGEEFVVLLAGCDETQALAVARTLCANVAQAGIAHANREDGRAVMTISAGVAEAGAPGCGRTREQLLRCADACLYAAKSGGRNCARAGAVE